MQGISQSTFSKKNGKRIDVSEIIQLFQKRPGYTRNYAEKLFEFDQYSAITTAGHAYINGKPVKELVREIKTTWEAKQNFDSLSIDDKLEHIRSTLESESIQHINANDEINETAFIYSCYNLLLDKPQVFKITIASTTKDEINKGKTGFVTYFDNTQFGIVTDGQDFIIDRFIFGSMYRNKNFITNIFLDRICKELKCKKATKNKIRVMLEKENLLKGLIQWDLNVVDIRPLSLQEAIDLAALLLRIVMDIQVYTEKIPTVGGVIKLAIIGKDIPFKFISGNEITKPKLVY